MAEPRQPLDAGHARLLRIEFPRGDVEVDAPAFRFDDPPDPPRQAIWIEAEVASSRPGPRGPHPAESGRPETAQFPPRRRDPKGRSRRARNAIAVVVDGVDARIDGEALFDEDGKRPERAFDDREARSAVGVGGRPGRVFDPRLRAADVESELRRG